MGHRFFYDSTGQSEMMFGKPYSEETARLIDQETNDLLKECYQLAKRILWENREGLKALAELLLDREVIFTEDLERIFGKRQAGAKNPLEDSTADSGTTTAAAGTTAAEDSTAATTTVADSATAAEGSATTVVAGDTAAAGEVN